MSHDGDDDAEHSNSLSPLHSLSLSLSLSLSSFCYMKFDTEKTLIDMETMAMR